MKFDFIIGNPPYQEEAENSGDRANPLYDKFMDKAFEIADIVLLIHPARFLFNAGQTQKRWNQIYKLRSKCWRCSVLYRRRKSYENYDEKNGWYIGARKKII